MQAPFISIIVPVFNVEKYIHKCIDSILCQNYDSFELILVNDGSTDNSGKFCDEYAFKFQNVKVIHQKNGGLSNARNTGISNAVGKYLWFVDSDDWISENAISIIASEVFDDLEILGFYESKFIEKHCKLIDRLNMKTIGITSGNLYIAQNVKFVPAVCFYVYKADFLIQNNLLFKEKLIHEDDYFNLQCFSLVKRIKKINKVLYYYRIRDNSIITGKVTLERLNSYLEIVKLCITLKNSCLDIQFIDGRIRSYLSIFFENLVEFQCENKNYIVEKLIVESKEVLGKQRLYKNDLIGVIFEKVLFNFSAKLYFFYKKMNSKNRLKK